MKTCKYILTLLVFGNCIASFCDVIPENSHYVDKCVKITNVDEFQHVYFIGCTPGESPMPIEPYIISSENCLTKGYKLNGFEIYAIPKKIVDEKDIANVDFQHESTAVPSNIAIDPWAGYVHDSIPLESVEEYYRIIGFTSTNVMLYKCKEILHYNDDTPTSIAYYEYDGDTSDLKRDIILNNEIIKHSSGLRIHPNPARNTVHIVLDNQFIGNYLLMIISNDGKVVQKFTLNKDVYTCSERIPLMNIGKGNYFFTFVFGDMVEVRKVIIE